MVLLYYKWALSRALNTVIIFIIIVESDVFTLISSKALIFKLYYDNYFFVKCLCQMFSTLYSQGYFTRITLLVKMLDSRWKGTLLKSIFTSLVLFDSGMRRDYWNHFHPVCILCSWDLFYLAPIIGLCFTGLCCFHCACAGGAAPEELLQHGRTRTYHHRLQWTSSEGS